MSEVTRLYPSVLGKDTKSPVLSSVFTLPIENLPIKPSAVSLNPYKTSVLFVGHMQTMQTQTRRHRTRRLISLHCCLTDFDFDEKYHPNPLNGNGLIQLISVGNCSPFKRVNFKRLHTILKKLILTTRKGMKNYPACKEIKTVLLILLSSQPRVTVT